MTRRQRADKPDANKAAIVAALRERGYIWLDVGGSVDGIAIGYSQITESTAAVLVEIKNPEQVNLSDTSEKNMARVYTPSERELIAALKEKGYHGVHITAVYTEDILRWFGVL